LVCAVSEKHAIRNGVVATVVGGIVLAALGKLWPPASRAFAALWDFLTASVPIPAWLALLVGGFSTALAVRTLRTIRAPGTARALHESPPESSAASAPAVNVRLEVPGGLLPLEREVLKRLAKADGEPVARDTMKRSLATTNLRLQAAEDRLVDTQLIEVLQNVEDVEDVVLVLTARGRQYVVEHGLA
jgi:hypothetical protein